MDRITLQNYRCFRDRQSACLAPLTLLVGENSTGKTSFMAMVRILWDVVYQNQVPDFKEAPYDLGSFDEIAHHRGSRGGRAETFEAGFDAILQDPTELESGGNDACKFSITFERDGTVPVPSVIRVARGEVWMEQHFDVSQKMNFRGHHGFVWK